jgi:neutral ceramidase
MGSLRAFLALACVFVAGALTAGCNPVLTLPAPASPPPEPGPNGLQAGFGRADITPPPGLGIQAYGPSGGAATGFRTRLYARTIVLEDADGQRVAFVSTDLGNVSILLHREIARRTAAAGIGADRLLLGATHAHSGPGHFFSEQAYNKYAAGVQGFDPRVVDFLAERVAGSVIGAAQGLRPAAVGWVRHPVWGLTRNRSLVAHDLNPPVPDRPSSPGGLDPDMQAVDPTWTLLRVDTVNVHGRPVPAGALSVFSFHPTGNPWANDLFDGDVPAIVERGLERHMDSLSGSAESAPVPRSVHLWFNGGVGDVSLAGLPQSHCVHSDQVRRPRPGGPRTPPSNDGWWGDSELPGSACVRESREFVNRVGDALTTHAIDLFTEAGAGMARDVSIGRSFRTYDLIGEEAPDGLCPEPFIGRGAGGGAEDGMSELRDWKMFGFVDLGMREGATEPDPVQCQSPKKRLHWLMRLGLGPLELPKAMQLMVVRVGDLLLAAVPAEPTTEAAFRMRESVLGAARMTPPASPVVSDAAVISLANGYVQYIATSEEYAAQHYEGGSTLYGQGTLEVVSDELRRLTRELAAGGDAAVYTVDVHPGRSRDIFPESDRAPSEPRSGGPRVDTAECSRDTVVVGWYEPGSTVQLPSDGPLIRLSRTGTAGQRVEVWDDDREVEIRGLGSRVGKGYLWEARWALHEEPTGTFGATFLRWRGPGNTREWECR